MGSKELQPENNSKGTLSKYKQILKSKSPQSSNKHLLNSNSKITYCASPKRSIQLEEKCKLSICKFCKHKSPGNKTQNDSLNTINTYKKKPHI